MKKILYTDKNSIRLDEFLAIHAVYPSRSQSKRAIESGLVSVNGDFVMTVHHALKPGDLISASKIEAVSDAIHAEKMNLDIIFEDENTLILNKPAGVVVHPGAGNFEGTLCAGVLNYLSDSHTKSIASKRAGLVHRLDKDTSGVILFAKNNEALVFYSDQFKNREIKKTYKAIVYGFPKEDTGEICGRIVRHPKVRTKMSLSSDNTRGRWATTKYSIESKFRLKSELDKNKYFSTLSLRPLTGRTHQIRVHLKSINCPIIGDSTYAGSHLVKEYPPAPRHLLHAYSLEVNIMNMSRMKFVTPLPDDFAEYIKRNGEKIH